MAVQQRSDDSASSKKEVQLILKSFTRDARIIGNTETSEKEMVDEMAEHIRKYLHREKYEILLVDTCGVNMVNILPQLQERRICLRMQRPRYDPLHCSPH